MQTFEQLLQETVTTTLADIPGLVECKVTLTDWKEKLRGLLLHSSPDGDRLNTALTFLEQFEKDEPYRDSPSNQ